MRLKEELFLENIFLLLKKELKKRWLKELWPDIQWWEFRKTRDLTWWDCMLEVFEPQEIESAFGPIPGRED